ncbi:MAG: hypothetical protein JO314_01700, partial [Acidobacteria bacterium]|nr:hypothetical protein [Acidobacteriota bacterium]
MTRGFYHERPCQLPACVRSPHVSKGSTPKLDIKIGEFDVKMKLISETEALAKLGTLKDDLRSNIAAYETKAQPCAACETPGACCLDEHFVNVRISRLEAIAIEQVIQTLPPVRRAAVDERILNAAAAATEFFACPLYEKSIGCLVHNEAKPVPCIVHACYERCEELPPDQFQDSAELAIDRLNRRVYRSNISLLPLPVA